jgi:adenylosuccinate lyase
MDWFVCGFETAHKVSSLTRPSVRPRAPPPLRRSERYKTPLSDVFSRQHKLDLEHRVEVALLVALGEAGLAPAEAAAEAREAIAAGRVTLARTLEIEKDTQHDIMAVVKAITEQCPKHGGFVHFGATSQDVNDTVLALQLTECRAALLESLRAVRR